MPTKLKVLVFDDNENHRAAAKAQLKDHDLTVVGTYDEAQRMLKPQVDHDKVTVEMEKFDGPPSRPDGGGPSEEWIAAYEQATKQATTYSGFDVVLTDLLVPTSKQEQSSMELVGKEMPVGIFIGLLAAVKGGAKYVAVFTDSSHHSHPASACFDIFSKGEGRPSAFTVEGSKLILCNNRKWVEYFDPTDLAKVIDPFKDLPSNVSPNQRIQEWAAEGKVVRAKNWAALLEYLLKQ